MAVDDVDFLGRGWSFPPSFDAASGQVRMVGDAADIEQSLHILFTTLRQERVMLPDYGADLREFVFDGADSALFARIQTRLAKAILAWEPRIDVDRIVVSAAGQAEGWVEIALSYVIRQTNARSNMVFPFYLQGEGTNVRPLG